LRVLVEDGLRHVLAAEGQRPPYELPDRSVGSSDAPDPLEALSWQDRPRVRGPVVHDARIAASCVAHGVDELLSRDRDFPLFPELRVVNPFAGS
jgi:predicted nucleic acid-binding protein